MSKTQPNSQAVRVALIAGWLTRFHQLFERFDRKPEDLPEIADDFAAALEELDPEALNWAFAEWRKHGKRFPVPADIHDQIAQRETAQDTLESEKAWDHVQWLLHTFAFDPMAGFRPLCVSRDTRLSKRLEASVDKQEFKDGYLLHPKYFDPQTQYAIQSVGGLGRIAELGPKDHDFCKRAFLQAHRYSMETQGLLAPSREEAKALVEGLKQIGERETDI